MFSSFAYAITQTYHNEIVTCKIPNIKYYFPLSYFADATPFVPSSGVHLADVFRFLWRNVRA